MTIRPPRRTYLWIWLLWLAAFYAVWLWLVFGHGQLSTVLGHWPIAAAMALGSYVAGSTPMGGGTVGFPFLVLLFEMPASLGRDFSFAVQSIGMTSASIFIFCRRQPLARSVLNGAIVGALFGVPVGIFLIAPWFSDLWIKVSFATIWAGFGLLHLYRLDEIAGHQGMTEFSESWDFRLGMIVGLLSGATIVSVTGVGIDMVIYACLVLLIRTDLKIAIPTSVVIMAVCSVYGVAIKFLFMGFQPETYQNWLAAAPIVALGAPLGVLIVSLIGRKPTLLFVAILCVGQFLWTCYNEWGHLGWTGTAFACLLVGALLFIFERLRLYGDVLAGDRPVSQVHPGTGHLSSLGIEEAEPHVHSHAYEGQE
jgi:uncharacterized membrane protein YfcA